MSKIVSAQHEMLLLKKFLESRNPELLLKINKDLFGNAELARIYHLAGILYADYGSIPSFDLLNAELSNRVTNQEKQKFYTGLLQDIKDKDASGITTEDLIKSLDTQRQFRSVLSGASKLVDAVESRDADDAVGILKEMYESMFNRTGEALDDGDMVNLAGQSVEYSFRKSGLKALDKHGPFAEKGLTLIGAPSKAGKSILALQFLTYGHDNYEGSSCYYSYEMSQQEVKTRILSAKSDVNIGLITSGMLNTDEKFRLREAEVAHLCDYTDNMKDFIVSTMNETDQEFFSLFWSHFKPRQNRFIIPNRSLNWDELFLNMQMMVEMKNVKTFVIDYISLVTRGKSDSKSAPWEYLLNRSRDLKTFARNFDCRIITPVQIDDTPEGKIRWGSGIITDCDLCLVMTQEDGDKEFGPMGCSTVKYKAFRNFQSVQDEPPLQPFKLLRRFDVCRFEDFDF